jgi:hypothetical protein
MKLTPNVPPVAICDCVKATRLVAVWRQYRESRAIAGSQPNTTTSSTAQRLLAGFNSIEQRHAAVYLSHENCLANQDMS